MKLLTGVAVFLVGAVAITLALVWLVFFHLKAALAAFIIGSVLIAVALFRFIKPHFRNK